MVLVAGGVGVTPVRAILDDLPPDVEVDLLYRAPKAEALVLRDELVSRLDARPLRVLLGVMSDLTLTMVAEQEGITQSAVSSWWHERASEPSGRRTRSLPGQQPDG